MNAVYHRQAKVIYSRCQDMMEMCVIYAVHGEQACPMCTQDGMGCAARVVRDFLDREYTRRGGDLMDLHSVIDKKGRIKLRL